MGLPEVFYGNNYLLLTKPGADFLLEISAVDAISFASYAKRTECMRDSATQGTIEENKTGNEQLLNLIDTNPKNLKVRESAVWQNKDTSKIADFSTVEVFSDWTHSTPYKASVRFLSNHVQRIKNKTAL